ncbi:hypothetical protein C8R42DRAFT_641009 [Lentinula raphanica]|nr:hypothetical protein C8R42DRAFT_641009 [Lentinula raphanica]
MTRPLHLQLSLFVSMAAVAGVLTGLYWIRSDYSLTVAQIIRIDFTQELTQQATYIMINKFSFMSRSLLTCLLCAMFIGAFSSPLPLTPNNTTSAGRLEERNQVARGYSGQFSSLTARLLRTNKQGKTIKPGTKVTKDEEWTLFFGPNGFNASPGPGGTLTAEAVKSEKDNTGHSVSSTTSTQDLGEKASFGSAAERDKVFKELLTQVPALR